MTLRSVAEKAGVAVDTARKVLRGDPTVRPYIRTRVQRVIRETGYSPNLVARALRQNHLDLVPLSVMRLDLPYFGLLATLLSERVVEWGAEPALCLDTKHLMAMCRSYATRGCIVMNHIAGDDLRSLAATQKIVLVNQIVPRVDGVSEISIDFDGAYRNLAAALLARGRRRVAVVSPYWIEAGRKGWKRQKFGPVFEVLAQSGLSPVAPGADGAFPDAGAFGAWLRDNPGGADAVLCENDLVGAAVVGEISRLGLRTPDDALVVGCDADIPVPGMWSVRVDAKKVAKEAVDILRNMVDGGAAAVAKVFTPVPVDGDGREVSRRSRQT